MDVIDEELKSFLESEVTVVVGTHDGSLVPEVTFAWGPRVLEGGREVDVMVDTAAGEKTLENLRSSRAIAVNFASPISYEAVQLKGWSVEIGEPTEADRTRLDRHREAWMEAVRTRGSPAHASRTMWSTKVTRVRFLVEEVFDQTPGPEAGRKL